MFCKSFIIRVTTSYLQHVFNMLNICKNVLQHFSKCFSVGLKHLQNILGVVTGYTCKIKH